MADIQDRALTWLKRSLIPIPQELNEIDWKSGLSPNKDRLKEHLSAFSNYPGGGLLVFGISDAGEVTGVKQPEAKRIVEQLGNLAANALNQRVQVTHASITYDGEPLLIVHIPEALEKPAHIRGKSIEESYIRSGGQTRKMTRQDLRVAITSSRSLRFEEIPVTVPGESQPLDQLLDFNAIVARAGTPFAVDTQAGQERLHELRLLAKTSSGFVPTNLGLLACAKDLSKIATFERYAVQIGRAHV